MKTYRRITLLLCLLLPGKGFAQDTLSGMFTIPAFEVRHGSPFDEEYHVWISSLLRYRATFLQDVDSTVATEDTVLVSDAFSDTYMFTTLRLDTLPKSRFPYRFCHGIRHELTYTLPTSDFWRKANHGLAFRYVDCIATLTVQDLGTHQAKLVNRLGSAPKDHFIERPVRVLYILEYLELKGACEPLDSLGR